MGKLSGSLSEYAHSEAYPFHMPGHKRNMSGFAFADAFSCDITEIEGFDNLHQAEAVILEVEQTGAALYGSEETHLLVNGSTAGILSAIAGALMKRGRILIARNSHKAAYNALYLNELKGIFIYPKLISEFGICGSICPQEVERALAKDSEIQAVFITSPTYDGIVSDVEAIANIAHKYGIPLIVDEAHGAHFGFYKPYVDRYRTRNSVQAGADIVIQSIHKTLPSFTQTSLIHLNGTLIDRESIRQFLAIYQSSSPSYVLMAGMDQCFDILKQEGNARFQTLAERLEDFYEKSKELRHLKVISPQELLQAGAYGADPAKLLISTKMTHMSGKELYDCLRTRYQIQCEMAAGDYCLGIATIMDSQEGFTRLLAALKEIDGSLSSTESRRNPVILPRVEKAAEIWEALSSERFKKSEVKFSECAGEISCDYIYAYPPGIPILAPGEKVSSEIIHSVGEMERAGLHIVGVREGNFTVGREVISCVNT